MNPPEWESLSSELRRIEVPGGWLYENKTGQMVFVPYTLTAGQLTPSEVEALDD